MIPATPAIESLAAFLDASPSPFHAARSSASMLRTGGFVELTETEAWEPVEAAFIRRGGALVAWRRGAAPGFRIVGAHTDSPGLRIKPSPDSATLGWRQLGVEVYGGPLLNSWLDRDLGVAGRVVAADGTSSLLAVNEPIARVPQLAIHLDREVNDKGLLLDKQQHLTPVWGTGSGHPDEFRSWVADRLGWHAIDVAAWELQLFDVAPAGRLGADRTLFASGRLDNQVSCWAATVALLTAQDAPQSQVIALFDHEEVGSASTTGAAGPLLETVLWRIAGNGTNREDTWRAFAASTCVSADNAHAVHPNYVDRHDPAHRPVVNGGPAIKLNSNQRYATSATTAALFARACATAGVPVQQFVSRNTMPCGSTIGPLSATRLGIETVDVGVPQLSMHSARELCGSDDPPLLAAALRAYLTI